MLLAWLSTIALAPPANAYKPEDPEVRAMVDRAVKYLEGLTEEQLKATPYGGGDAQVVLAAYAHLKAEHNHDAPIIKLGLKNALQYVKTIQAAGGRIQAEPKSVYEIPIVIFFLTEFDAQQYAEELSMLGQALLNLQKPTGGFGYPDYKTGDVSQVQYVSLATWTLDRAGIDLPLDRVAQMLAWILRVQDVSGAWPYQAEDPGPGRGLIQQPHEEMTVTMSYAGGSCALIAADVFRLWDNASLTNSIEGLPKALRPVEKSTLVEQRRKRSPVKPEVILQAMKKMENHRASHPLIRNNSPDWYYYMLYTLERYESFMEIATGKSVQPGWYDDNVKLLMKIQDSSGAWAVKDASKNGPPVSTAFAILFLIRSTQKAISNVSTGSMRGGYGIPKNTADIQVKGSQIVAKPVSQAVDDLLGMLEDDGANDIDGQSIPEDLKLESDPARRRTQLDRLTRLVRGSQSWQARRVAARVLGSSDDLSVVPALIYAISDPDKTVRTYALDGLNFISRKFVSEKSLTTDPNSADIRRAQQEWTAWYKKIDPGYQSIDGG